MTDTTEYKVRHGLVEYHTAGKRDIAFRNMKIHLEPAEAERLVAHGAVVEVDAELDKAGQMMALPDTATDEQIIGWVGSALPSEVRSMIIERPMLGERLRAAFADNERKLKEQNDLLSGVMGEVEAAEEAAAAAASARVQRPSPGSADPNAVPVPPVPDAQQINPNQTAADGQPALSASDSLPADEVILGNVSQISSYLSEHPTESPMILDAENRRVESARSGGKADEQPRAGVLRAVEAAAAHAAS